MDELFSQFPEDMPEPTFVGYGVNEKIEAIWDFIKESVLPYLNKPMVMSVSNDAHVVSQKTSESDVEEILFGNYLDKLKAEQEGDK